MVRTKGAIYVLVSKVSVRICVLCVSWLKSTTKYHNDVHERVWGGKTNTQQTKVENSQKKTKIKQKHTTNIRRKLISFR